MMPNQKDPRGLLLVIDAFVKVSKTNTNKKYLEKALALVNLKFGEPCCSNPSGTIDLITPYNNNFTNTVRMILATMNEVNDYKVLLKAKTKLENLITNPCCV